VPRLMHLHYWFLYSLVLAAMICQDQFGHDHLGPMKSDQFFVVFEMPAVGMRMVAKTGHKDCAGIVYILADASPKGIVPVVGQWLLSQFV